MAQRTLGPPTQFSPFGFVGAAKVRLAQRNVGAAILLYEELVRRFPSFTMPDDCLGLAIMIEPEQR